MSRQTNPQVFYVLRDSDLYLYACKFPAQPFEHIDVGEYVWWFDRILAFNHQLALLVDEWLFGKGWCMALQAVEVI